MSLLYADPQVSFVNCPVPDCAATVGIWCGVISQNPAAHERRIALYNKYAAMSPKTLAPLDAKSRDITPELFEHSYSSIVKLHKERGTSGYTPSRIDYARMLRAQGWPIPESVVSA